MNNTEQAGVVLQPLDYTFLRNFYEQAQKAIAWLEIELEQGRKTLSQEKAMNGILHRRAADLQAHLAMQGKQLEVEKLRGDRYKQLLNERLTMEERLRHQGFRREVKLESVAEEHN